MINDVCLDELYDLRYLLLVAIASRLLTVKKFLISWQIPPVSCAVGNDDDYVNDNDNNDSITKPDDSSK